MTSFIQISKDEFYELKTMLFAREKSLAFKRFGNWLISDDLHKKGISTNVRVLEIVHDDAPDNKRILLFNKYYSQLYCNAPSPGSNILRTDFCEVEYQLLRNLNDAYERYKHTSRDQKTARAKGRLEIYLTLRSLSLFQGSYSELLKLFMPQNFKQVDFKYAEGRLTGLLRYAAVLSRDWDPNDES